MCEDIKISDSVVSSEIDNLNLEDKSRIRRDGISCSLISIRVMRRASQLRLLTFLQLGNAFIPTSDHLTHAHLELEGRSSFDTGVEHSAIEKFSSVVNFDVRAFGHDWACAFVKLLYFQRLHLNEAFSDEIFNLR